MMMSTGSRIRCLIPLGILAATILAYLPVLQAGFVSDDHAYVVENSLLTSLPGLKAIWLEPLATPQYYPMVFTSFWVEHHLWGENPFGYHAVNVTMHAANAYLYWILLRRIEVPAALLGAMIFSLHPVQVESVAWVSERKNLMCVFFYLLAGLAWLQFISANRRVSYLFVLVAFTCAMLSKTTAVAFPIVCGLLAWWLHPYSWQRYIPSLGPIMMIAVGLASVTIWRENNEFAVVLPSLSVPERLVLAGQALSFYVGKLVWPTNLTFLYPKWDLDASSAASFLPLSVSLIATLVLWLCRNRVGRGAFVAVAFFQLSVAPTLGLVSFAFMQFSFVADHFQYLATLGPIGLAAASLGTLLRRRNELSRLLGVAVSLLLVGLGILTFRQSRLYTSAESLWRDTVGKNPQSAYAHQTLGLAYLGNGELEKAATAFRTAIGLDSNFAQAHNSLGTVLWNERQYEAAIDHVRTAIRLNPALAMPHSNLSVFLYHMNKQEEAIAHAKEAVRLKPQSPSFQANLGAFLFLKNDITGAISHYSEAVRLEPNSALFQSNLGSLLAKRGETQRALVHIANAVQLDPENADFRNSFGMLLLDVGDIDAASKQFREALRIQPNHAAARKHLEAANAARESANE